MVLLDTLQQETCPANDEKRSSAVCHISATCFRSASFIRDTDGKHNDSLIAVIMRFENWVAQSHIFVASCSSGLITYVQLLRIPICQYLPHRLAYIVPNAAPQR